jgi:hypothetical protein
MVTRVKRVTKVILVKWVPWLVYGDFLLVFEQKFYLYLIFRVKLVNLVRKDLMAIKVFVVLTV